MTIKNIKERLYLELRDYVMIVVGLLIYSFGFCAFILPQNVVIGGYVYINGELLEEDESYDKIADPGIAENEIILGIDEYFVLGDNRNNSEDSRSGNIGIVDKDNITGKAWFHLGCEEENMGFIK